MEDRFIKQVIEALLFASDVPLSETKLSYYVDGVEIRQLRQYINEINEEYNANHRAFMIQRVAGGYQIVTRPEFSPWLKQLLKGKIKTRLSQASLEALAIIAFKQPISRPQIEAIRGIQCDGVVKNLLERGLITIAGRAETVGRPLLYKTADEFLRYFGINQIDDLPKPKEIEELIGQGKDLEALSLSLGQRDLFGNDIFEKETAEENSEEENFKKIDASDDEA